MKVLVVGGGGREHALCWKIAQSDRVEKVFCAPGNAGIEKEAECLAVGAEDLDGIVKAARQKGVDLVVIGPEAPLAMGLADRLEAEGIRAFGASKEAAELEGSKAFAKNIMKKYSVPTADFQVFQDPAKAKHYIKSASTRLVVKADGLAAGKGVIVCESKDQALDAVELIMEKKQFGAAGDKVVVEERLEGEEASFLAFTDGEHVLPLASSQDHKAIYDGGRGPNTGGMGAYSPAAVVTDELHKKIMERVMEPVVRGMAEEGRTCKGVLYAGLMIKDGEPGVLEFNVRFGDPETQPLLFRMESDIMEFIEACVAADGSLKGMEIKWGRPSVCVVMASDGYPGRYQKGFEIKGLDRAEKMEDVYVFHAGTANKDGRIVTAGGRVLGVTARGADVPDAISRAYRAVRVISWDGAYCRTDIGNKALSGA